MLLGSGWAAGSAYAAKQAKPGKAPVPAADTARAAQGKRRGHYAFGTITAINGSTITIRPETPDFVQRRAAAGGRTAKELPASLSFTVDANTTYQRKGRAARLGDYQVGDQVAAVLAGKVSRGEGVALKLLDIDSVRQTYGKLADRLAQRPIYGTVLALDRGSLTLQPEVPQFVLQQREARAAKRQARAEAVGSGAATTDSVGKDGKAKGKRQAKQPAPVVVKLAAATQFWQNNTPVQGDPFRVGDKVAVFPAPGGTRTDITAGSVMDYGTAQSQQSKRHKRSSSPKAGKHKRPAKAPG
jgi:hypothetical protein